MECGYHGFAFGCDGVCTRVPAQSSIPARARVRVFPVVERDGWVWVWTGDVDRADESLVPDTHWMNDPEWATVTHSYRFECRADLVHDNLLDLTHESFLHQTTVGDDYIYEYGITVEVDGTTVTVDRLMPGVPWTNVYGLARTLLALGTAGTLIFSPTPALFAHASGAPQPPYCDAAARISIYCIAPHHSPAFAQWGSVAILMLAASGWRPRWTARGSGAPFSR